MPWSPPSATRCLIWAGLLLDRRQALGDVAERDREVADIRQTGSGRIDPVQRMIAVHQHPAGLAYRGGSEPRPGPVGGAEVEGNARHANRRARIVAADAEEGRRNAERRDCGHRGCPESDSADGVNKNTATATTQVQSPRGAPVVAAAIECVSTMRLLNS